MTEGSSPAKTFVGVRFLLLGFDPFDKHQVRSKLVDCGGEDVAHYSPNCTHVIVDKIVMIPYVLLLEMTPRLLSPLYGFIIVLMSNSPLIPLGLFQPKKRDSPPL
ncbi:BRCT domain-containing protein At4g02110-like isoform X2 [Malus domestica]|uniref:BRCT domain-containing protein At4g02110-like isoform X2 n=1 Tax=Malus domestica TaxID=3750 RepID=UPI0010A9FBFA|nr:BRCT domain-containing protein At4g02110-like isoform X3 [Malus domestica]